MRFEIEEIGKIFKSTLTVVSNKRGDIFGVSVTKSRENETKSVTVFIERDQMKALYMAIRDHLIVTQK